MARTRPSAVRQKEPKRAFSWVELGLCVASLTLVFQLFPGMWSHLVGALDVRGWTWRAYAVCCAVWIVALVAIKAWRDNASDE